MRLELMQYTPALRCCIAFFGRRLGFVTGPVIIVESRVKIAEAGTFVSLPWEGTLLFRISESMRDR